MKKKWKLLYGRNWPKFSILADFFFLFNFSKILWNEPFFTQNLKKKKNWLKTFENESKYFPKNFSAKKKKSDFFFFSFLFFFNFLVFLRVNFATRKKNARPTLLGRSVHQVCFSFGFVPPPPPAWPNVLCHVQGSNIKTRRKAECFDPFAFLCQV